MQATENYGLIIYEPNDITSYLINWNNTMQKIDTSIAEVSVVAEKTKADILTAEQSLANANDEINELTGEVSDVKQELNATTTRSQTNSENIVNIKTDITSINTKVDNGIGTRYTGILSTNEDTIAIATSKLNENSLIDIYTDIYGLAPLTVTPDYSAKQVVLTFNAQPKDTHIIIIIK